MPTVVNIHDAKTHLSRLIRRAAAGEDIIIAKAGVPTARLIPYRAAPAPRVPGVWKGEVWMSDDFDDPVPADLLAAFHDGDIDPRDVIALLDTHAVLWWLSDDRRLGTAARDLVADPATVVFVSAASVWEIAIKRAIGRLRAPEGLAEIVDEADLEPLPVGFDHAERVGSLPLHHSDPFDRLLVAQAQIEGATLVTADRRLAAYDVPRLDAGAARP